MPMTALYSSAPVESIDLCRRRDKVGVENEKDEGSLIIDYTHTHIHEDALTSEVGVARSACVPHTHD